MLLINFVARSKIVKFILQDFVEFYCHRATVNSGFQELQMSGNRVTGEGQKKSVRSAVGHKWLKVIYMTIKSMSVILEA